MPRMDISGTAFMIAMILLVPTSASAGFFDQLFGGGRRSGTFFGFPTYGGEDVPIRHYSRPRKIADEKPVLQKPTDLMHDETLRFGDAVMTTSGIKIFTGKRAPTHDLDDFTPLRVARYVKANEKSALSEMDIPRSDHDAIDFKGGERVSPKPSGELVTGRSAIFSNSVYKGPLIKGAMMTDRDGKSIRYVGP